jgi:hypothetical protein
MVLNNSEGIKGSIPNDPEVAMNEELENWTGGFWSAAFGQGMFQITGESFRKPLQEYGEMVDQYSVGNVDYNLWSLNFNEVEEYDDWWADLNEAKLNGVKYGLEIPVEGSYDNLVMVKEDLSGGEVNDSRALGEIGIRALYESRGSDEDISLEGTREKKLMNDVLCPVEILYYRNGDTSNVGGGFDDTYAQVRDVRTVDGENQTREAAINSKGEFKREDWEVV